MARFDLFEAPDGSGMLVAVQSDLIDVAKTRVVIPLLPTSITPRAIDRLHPVFSIEGRDHVLATHLIATVPGEILVGRRGSLSAHRDEITTALDMLFHGF